MFEVTLGLGIPKVECKKAEGKKLVSEMIGHHDRASKRLTIRPLGHVGDPAENRTQFSPLTEE